MASSAEESSVRSPDSTASSLLTSGSANSRGPCSNSLIRYKDKLYSSASEALEAYIEDFNLSLTSPEVSTGKICICQSTPKRAKLSERRARQDRGTSPQGLAMSVCLGSAFSSVLGALGRIHAAARVNSRGQSRNGVFSV